MWVPGDFETYRERWPRTPAFARPDPALGTAFAAAWSLPAPELDARLRAGVGRARVVFVRGYLGNLMPGNLMAPVRALRELGIDAAVAPTSTGATVASNVDRLAAWLDARPGPLLLCGHSKGGLEALRVADVHPAVRARLVGVVLSQTPRGPSAVLESLLLGAHDDSLGRRRRVEEWTQRAGLHVVGAATGGRQLTEGPLAELIAQVDATPRAFPVWQTASWSSAPTTWLDSFHERLGEIRPGCAHDGQFFLEDLIWPGLPHVLLPQVDHAQPAMGGHGFDHVRYWKLLLTLFCGGA